MAAEKDALVLEPAAKVSRLDRLVSDLREEENARLKGLKAWPQIKPSGMESATTAKPTGKRDRRRDRGKVTPKVAVDDEMVTAALRQLVRASWAMNITLCTIWCGTLWPFAIAGNA